MNKKQIWDHIRFVLLVILVFIFVFDEPLQVHGYPWMYGIHNYTAIGGFFVLLFDAAAEIARRAKKTGNLRPEDHAVRDLLCLAAFSAAGLAGFLKYHYQAWNITFYAMFETVRFWLQIPFFKKLFRGFPLRKYSAGVLVPAFGLTVYIVGMTAWDVTAHIWPRQVYRHGIGSIQIFYGHPTQFVCHCAFLLLLFVLLAEYWKISLPAAAILCFPVFMSLRTRAWGFLACFGLVIILVLISGKKVGGKSIAAVTAAGLAAGGRRLYDFYFSAYAHTVARGQFAINCVRIAKKEFPFGTGFGTFGSRMSQYYYSPVYYWYNMMYTPGLDPAWPSYACDAFWPMIIGETGAAGLLCYLLILLFLFLDIQKLWEKGKWIYLCAAGVLLFELMETTGTIAFSETLAGEFALLLGLVFGIREDGSREAGEPAGTEEKKQAEIKQAEV